jgi:hypothetical protein
MKRFLPLLSLLLLLLLPVPGWAAVAVSQTSSTSTNNTGVTTIDTANFTIASGETVVGFLMVRNASITGVTAVWDPAGANQSLTEVDSLVVNSALTLKRFAKLAPTAGVGKPIRFTWTGSGAAGAYGMALSGVDQTALATSFVHTTSNSGNSSTSSVTITSQVNNLTLDFVGVDNASVTLSSSTKTERIRENSMSLQVFGASSAVGAASNTHDWTISGAAQWGVLGVDVVAVGQIAVASRNLLLLGVGQ